MNLIDADDRRQAETVDCPTCRAPRGTTCVRGDGEPLVHAAAHTPRLTAAGVLHAPLDSRELR
jgi:hypothetical protein